MEFVDKFQTLVRNVSVAFEKPKQERSRCPRCRGSGLLAQKQFPWDWQHKAPSNDPCWFCEGIGVMPAGLSGFMLGRAPPVLHTRDINLHNQLPINVQLYLGKFPGTRPKFGTYKPCDGLLHDPSKAPDWLAGENFSSLEKAEAEGHSGAENRPLFARESSDRSAKTRSEATRSRGSSSKTKQQSFRVASRLSLQKLDATTKASPKAKDPELSTDSSGQIQADADEQAEARGPDSVHFGTPLLKSSKVFKIPRKGRNRIREEAEKEAAQRARRVQGGAALVSEMDEEVGASAAFASGTFSSTESFSSRSKQQHLPFLPWVEASKRPSASDYSWVNQMVYGSIKERVPHSPISGKVFL